MYFFYIFYIFNIHNIYVCYEMKQYEIMWVVFSKRVRNGGWRTFLLRVEAPLTVRTTLGTSFKSPKHFWHRPFWHRRLAQVICKVNTGIINTNNFSQSKRVPRSKVRVIFFCRIYMKSDDDKKMSVMISNLLLQS